MKRVVGKDLLLRRTAAQKSPLHSVHNPHYLLRFECRRFINRRASDRHLFVEWVETKIEASTASVGGSGGGGNGRAMVL